RGTALEAFSERPGFACQDQEDEVVVVVELLPLAEVLRILEGERMELKDSAERRKLRYSSPTCCS
ncbi:MAG TPA: hypothetical protein VK754_00615, partial [Propionibacteriaceae bacterium]|nr:hypothetical protein [Propionibacteriaceae bacterium]